MKKKIHSKSKKRNIKKTILISMLMFILILCVIYILYYFYNTNKQKQKNNQLLENTVVGKTDITIEKTERMLQVEELKKQNEDVVGWLEIPNTNINFPVLQGTDNEYYLTHTFDKQYSKDGSIFLDKDYKWNPPSSNLLLYGHNNKNGNMFQNLLEYKQEEYYKQHSTIRFTTETEDANYEIISVFLSRVYYKSEKDVFRYYYFINARNEEEYNDFVNNVKKVSIYGIDTTAKYGDQLLTLSTCEYSQKDGRFVVVAKK